MPKICTWGNSLGLRLPKEVAAAAGLGLVSGTIVRVRLLDNSAVLVTPTTSSGAAITTPVGIAVKPLKSTAKW